MKSSEFFARPFKTPFDDFDFSFSIGPSGAYIRDKLLEFQNQFGRVSEMASIAAKQMEEAEARYNLASNMAIAAITDKYAGDKSYTAVRKEALVSNWEVLLPGDKEKTTPYKEEMKFYSYKYLSQRGKDRVRELMSAIDLGRSVLSWDKQEVDRLER